MAPNLTTSDVIFHKSYTSQEQSLTINPVQDSAKKLPSHYELMSQRKGFRRYMTDDLRDILGTRAKALEDREAAMAGILKVLLPVFPIHRTAIQISA